MSLTNEEQQKQGSLAKVKLAVDTVFSAQVETARILGASDDALKAMINTKFKKQLNQKTPLPTTQIFNKTMLFSFI
jgi:hypothetical protein